MVDPINPPNVSRLRPVDASSPMQGNTPASTRQVQASDAVTDTVDSHRDISVAIERLSKLEPPMDAARIALVKAEILEGSYPLDSQRLADSLFRDIGTMMDD
ncbi:MAG: flagellar biosynthesis anti-sigma factor FlgM [Pseudomonadota bacterium]